MVRKGIQYVKSLLVGAKRVDQGTTNSKIFHKTGGIDKLKKDFYRFSPTEIRGFPLENGVSVKCTDVLLAT